MPGTNQKCCAQLTEKFNAKVLKAVSLVVDHIIIELDVAQVVSEKELLWGPSRKCDVPRYINKFFVGNLVNYGDKEIQQKKYEMKDVPISFSVESLFEQSSRVTGTGTRSCRWKSGYVNTSQCRRNLTSGPTCALATVRYGAYAHFSDLFPFFSFSRRAILNSRCPFVENDLLHNRQSALAVI